MKPDHLDPDQAKIWLELYKAALTGICVTKEDVDPSILAGNAAKIANQALMEYNKRKE